MPTDTYAHELRRKEASQHDLTAQSVRGDSGYSTASSTSSQSHGSHKSHSRSHLNASSSSSSSASKRSRARFSVPEDAQGLSKFASLTGFLRKQADNEEGAWNKYYFALRPTTYLYYYNSPSDDRPRGVIDMEFLQDIRYNVDCLQRCVGGSEHCFRVTGQIPKGTLKDAADTDKLKLRPVFLDPESSAEALQWMDALKKHRFNIDHAEGFHKMGQRIKETEHTLKQLGEEAQRVASTAESIRQKGRVLLNKLRGIAAEPEEDPESRGSFDVDSNQDDIFSTLHEIESLVEDLNAEAEQQAKVIETLREREAQQEKKLRDLTKFVAPVRKPDTASSSAIGAQQQQSVTDDSIMSAEELSRLEKVSVTKGRSTSDVRELFKKTTSFLTSKKATDTTNSNSNNVSPKLLESFPEAEEGDDDNEASVKKSGGGGGGFVGVLKKRVTKNTTTTSVTIATTPTFRESDDTVSISTDDRGSVEILPINRASSSLDEKLPPGWTKRESRTNPGDYYYAHTSGFTCWDLPTNFVTEEEPEEPPAAEAEASKTQPSMPQPQPTVAVSDVDLEKSDFYGKQPLGSLAAVAQAVMDAEADAAEPLVKEDEKPAKKSKGWGFLKKKFPKTPLTKTSSPKKEPSLVVAVEHADDRHEF